MITLRVNIKIYSIKSGMITSAHFRTHSIKTGIILRVNIKTYSIKTRIILRGRSPAPTSEHTATKQGSSSGSTKTTYSIKSGMITGAHFRTHSIKTRIILRVNKNNLQHQIRDDHRRPLQNTQHQNKDHPQGKHQNLQHQIRDDHRRPLQNTQHQNKDHPQGKQKKKTTYSIKSGSITGAHFRTHSNKTRIILRVNIKTYSIKSGMITSAHFRTHSIKTRIILRVNKNLQHQIRDDHRRPLQNTQQQNKDHPQGQQKKKQPTASNQG
ncbi:hypothetical protein RRG08_063658 [Elysia crispata]|uniref:Uncharacterized protein n=1 Tax=Elysia crispata TaxID=231223 RepID=A0AAE1AI77_9GAST|nr:hypothetical protein RRG08_063658 [Elysia crispata]